MSKKALVFIEDDVCKVVYGNSLKCVKISEAGLPYNAEFFSKLFASCEVVMVSSTQPLGHDGLRSAMASPAGPPVFERAASGGFQQATAQPPRQQYQQQPPVKSQGKTTWIRSNARCALTIDDLFINREIAPGIRDVLSIGPNRAVNLASIDPASIRRSNILRKLLQNGTLSPCTSEEASRLEESHYQELQQEQDERLDYSSPILPDNVSAEEWAANGGRHGMSRDDIETINISPDEPRPRRATNEDAGSMETLMEQIEESERRRMDEPVMQQQRHPLAQRTRVRVDPAMKAQGIVSRHRY